MSSSNSLQLSSLNQIKAAAGAGKTYTLTRQFLNLLAQAEKQSRYPACSLKYDAASHAWQEIMAVTFTNKAAAEMKERIIKELKERALAGDDESIPAPRGIAAKTWIELILRHYSSLNIRTIDSLLTLFLRLSSLDFELQPDFKIKFNPEEYFNPVFDLLLLNAINGNEELKEELKECCRIIIYDSRVTSFTPTRTMRNKLMALSEFNLTNEQTFPISSRQQISGKVLNLVKDLKERALILTALIEREELKAHKNFTTLLDKIEHLDNLPSECPTSTLMDKVDFTECLLKSSKQPSNFAMSAYEDLQTIYKNAVSSIPILHSAMLNASFARISQLLMEELSRSFREQGYIPASILPYIATKILVSETGPSEIFCRLGSTLKHILVDEFQDTSREQWQAILPLAVEALAKGGSLTCVGDSKQAIYGWRGGDASLFEEILICPDLTVISGEGVELSLPFNWRSSPVIVRHNNLVFSRLGDIKVSLELVQSIMPAETPQAIITEAASGLQKSFVQAEQKIPPEREHEKNKGLVSILRLEENSKAALEERIKSHLHNLLLNDIFLRRPYKDVAFLVRSNEQASKLADWLTSWQIPVVTENSLRLGLHPLVRQCIAFLNWLNMPLNDLALFEFLCGQELFGRVSGLSAEELEAWSLTRNTNIPLMQSFRKSWPDIWVKHLAPFYNQAGLMSAYDLVCELFDRYQVETEFSKDKVFILRFLEILHLAEQEELGSLPDFLEWWLEFGSQEKVPMPESLNAVRIMTIHKAKGLEFPVVIQPFQTSRYQAGTDFLLHEEEGLPVLVNLRKDLGEIYYRKLAERVQEAVNLMYVAWTRAANELYILLPKEKTARALSSGSIVDCLLKNFSLDFDGAEHRVGNTLADSTPIRTAIENDQAAADNGLKISASKIVSKPNSDKRPMDWLPRLKIFRNNLKEPEFDAATRGSLVHYCIEGLRISANPHDDALKAFSFGVRKSLLCQKDINAAKADIIKALTWLAALPESADWFANGVSEQSIVNEDGQILRADLVVYDNDSCCVLEFKTGNPSELPAPEHMAQISKYMTLLTKAQKLPVSGILVYLDQQKLIPVNI